MAPSARRLLSILPALAAFSSVGCSIPAPNTTGGDETSAAETSRRPERTVISETTAIERGKRVSDVHYDLYFEIGKEDEFRSTTTLAFNLSDTSDALEVDFHEGKILGLIVNGVPVSTPQYNGFFLTLAKENLVVGANTVVLDFTHAYSDTGAGLYRFQDPEDQEVYLYTDFEPFSANKLFPCFDQPDIKATFTLKTLAPAEWIVISSTRESSTTRKGGKVLWVFPTSKKFSTYLFPLHAGPYAVWKSSAGSIPLRLFARRSLAKYVRPDDWFTVTQQGFEYFNEYFNYPYPFGKYDQIIVPDFSWGAMENVAAVTFSERFVERGTPTRDDLEEKANTILHEMAHMWFGDLVTMKWWNDLWLNESFATYMAYLALAEATEFKKAWQSFYADTKQWAYWEDQLVTTHPIEVRAPDTDHAVANFDGITYGKGASALKQLAFFLGPEKFRQGVEAYFRTYAYQNATLADFIGSLEETSGINLEKWTQDWIRTASLNILEAKVSCEEGVVKSFALVQTAPDEYPTLRQHRTQVGFFYMRDEKLRLGKQRQVTYSAPRTIVPEFEGETCPDMIYPNYGDSDYVKVKLDSKSLDTAQNNLSKIQDPFVRLMFWQSLWDMVQDGQYSILDYANLVFSHLEDEEDIKIINSVGLDIYGNWDNEPAILLYLPKSDDIPQKFATDYQDRLEGFSWRQITKSEPGTDQQKFWLDAYVSVAFTLQGEARLKEILDGKIQFEGLEIDQDRRWFIIWSLNSIGSESAEKLIEVEMTRDPSERGQQFVLAARASQPSVANKKKWFSEILDPKNEMSLMRKTQIMSSLFPNRQQAFREELKDEFFANLPELVKGADIEFTRQFAESLAPTYCNQESIEELGAFIREHSELPPVVVKRLRVAKQEDERCATIRRIALSQILGDA